MTGGDAVVQLTVTLQDLASAGLNKVKGETAGVGQAAQSASSGVSALGSGFGTLRGILAALGLGVVAKHFLDVGASAESLKMSLKTVTGGAQQAELAFAWVKNFATQTPFQLMEVADAFKRLQSYGVDATKYMKPLGDMASAMGKPLMSAVEAMADAMTGEMERLKEFGITASQAGDKVTFSWEQNGQSMTKVVDKTKQNIQQAIAEIAKSRFDGAMLDQMNTWSGILSNFKDSITSFMQAIMDSGPLERLKQGLKDLGAAVSAAQKNGDLAVWATRIGQAFGVVADLVESFVGVFAKLASVTGATNLVASALEVLGAYLSIVKEHFKSLADYIEEKRISIQALGGTLKWLADNVIEAAKAIYEYASKFLPFVSTLESVGEWLKKSTSGLAAWLGAKKDANAAEQESARINAKAQAALDALNKAAGTNFVITKAGLADQKKMAEAKEAEATALDKVTQKLKAQADAHRAYDANLVAAYAVQRQRAQAQITDEAALFKRQTELVELEYRDRNQAAQGAFEKRKALIQSESLMEQVKDRLITAADDQKTLAQLKNLQDRKKNLEDMLSKALDAEKKYAEQVKASQQAVLDIQVKREEKMTEFRQRNMTDQQKAEDNALRAKKYEDLAFRESLKRTKEGNENAKNFLQKAQELYEKAFGDGAAEKIDELFQQMENIERRQGVMAAENQRQMKQAADDIQKKLEEMPKAIGDKIKELEDKLKIELKPDTKAVDAYLEKLQKPTKHVVQIVYQDKSGKEVPAPTEGQSSGGDAPESHRYGGIVGGIMRFAQGGLNSLTRMRGMLSGIGDHVRPILAEDGEFISDVSTTGAVGAGFFERLKGAVRGWVPPEVVVAELAHKFDLRLPAFAEGGGVGGAIPALSSGMAAGASFGTINLSLGGRDFPVQAQPDVAKALLSAIEGERARRSR